MEKDIEFTIIADGDLIYYDEIVTNSKVRTLKFNLASDVELVEIFGTQLKGITTKTSIGENPEKTSIIYVDKTEEVNNLVKENQMLKEENIILKEKNDELDDRIFELENLISALEKQVSNLNTIVTEQVKVIYNWVLGYSIN
jgi:predicted RNase H-like nuclease (RuvC/YqgF family)